MYMVLLLPLPVKLCRLFSLDIEQQSHYNYNTFSLLKMMHGVIKIATKC